MRECTENLFNHYSSSRIIGLSATPFRMKGGYLHTVRDAIFTEIVVDIPITGLMEEGFLSRCLQVKRPL